MIEIIKTGNLTFQDMGRYGYQKFGIPTSGVMDDYSARLVNFLVGNEANAPLLEFALQGPSIKFCSSAVFAIAGEVEAYLNESLITPWKSYWACRGDFLEIGTLRSGVYGYVTFAGGLTLPKIFGSSSSYPRAKLGELPKAGDKLKLGYALLTSKEGKAIPEELLPKYSATNVVSVILGPQLDHFTEEGIHALLNNEYKVTPKSDRMGYRLEGPRIKHSSLGADIITDAVPLGSIQVPSDGKPIIMSADRQTTGGYAKIGIVIKIDLPKVAQTSVGGRLAFKAINLEEAQELLMEREVTLLLLKECLEGRGKAYKIKAGAKEYLAFIEESEELLKERKGKLSPLIEYLQKRSKGYRIKAQGKNLSVFLKSF